MKIFTTNKGSSVKCDNCNEKINKKIKFCNNCGAQNIFYDEDSEISIAHGFKNISKLTIAAIVATIACGIYWGNKLKIKIPFILEHQPQIQVSTQRLTNLLECVYVLNVGSDTITIDSVQLNDQNRFACGNCKLAMGNSIHFPDDITQGMLGEVGFFMQPQNWVRLTIDVDGNRYSYQLK